MSFNDSLTELDWLQRLNGGGMIKCADPAAATTASDQQSAAATASENDETDAVASSSDVQKMEIDEPQDDEEVAEEACKDEDNNNNDDNPLKNMSNAELLQQLREKSADFVDPSTPEKTVKPSKT